MNARRKISVASTVTSLSAGAAKVYFASAAPAVKYPNVYGIDMPSVSELIANGRDTKQICRVAAYAALSSL